MSKTKRMRPSIYGIYMIIIRDQVPATGAYDNLESTPSSMDDQYSHVLEYISDWFFNVSCFKPERYSGSEYLCVWW